MASQEEWRKIAYELELGKRTGHSSGTIWGAKGAAEFHQKQAEQAARDRRSREINSQGFGYKPTTLNSSGTINADPSRRRSAEWETANTVVFLIAFAAGFLYLKFHVAMDTGLSLGISFVGGCLVGRFFKAIFMVAALLGMFEIYVWYSHHR